MQFIQIYLQKLMSLYGAYRLFVYCWELEFISHAS